MTIEEFLEQLEELVRNWKVKTSDDRFDSLQEACDDIRTDCADELSAIIREMKGKS